METASLNPSAQWPYVVERSTGHSVAEQPWGESALAWFYPHEGRPGWWTRALRSILAHTALPHHLMGWWFSRPGSRSLIPEFCQTFGVRLEDFDQPPQGWGSFNDFFMRRLRPGARSLPQDSCALVCPGEGRVRAYDATPPRLLIKGQRRALSDFFHDPQLAQDFEGGSCLLVRLCPSDYHRFHFPVSGEILKQQTLPGSLYSVHPWAERHKPDVWWRNARSLTLLQTPQGKVACFAIGATGVGSILLSASAGPVKAGDEWGAFALGGSALAIFFEPRAVQLDQDLLSNTSDGKETLCNVMTRVGQWLDCSQFP